MTRMVTVRIKLDCCLTWLTRKLYGRLGEQSADLHYRRIHIHEGLFRQKTMVRNDLLMQGKLHGGLGANWPLARYLDFLTANMMLSEIFRYEACPLLEHVAGETMN
jgi:hypothetical protein